MTIVPHTAGPHAEPAPFDAYPLRFDPLRCAVPTRTAVASLYALPTGWYRADHLAQALTAELPITESWLRNVLHWAARSGALRRRRWGAWRLVYVDRSRMARAWPDFDPSPYLLVPLDLDPIDTGPRAA